MPKPKKGARFGGSASHQKAIFANLATALFEHGRITTTLTQIIVDLVDFGMTLEQSIKAPKIMSTFSSKKGSFMEMEKGYSEKTVETLKKGLGYTVDVKSYPNLYFGGPNVIERSPDGTLTGIGSVRRGGSAAAPEL